MVELGCMRSNLFYGSIPARYRLVVEYYYPYFTTIGRLFFEISNGYQFDHIASYVNCGESLVYPSMDVCRVGFVGHVYIWRLIEEHRVYMVV